MKRIGRCLLVLIAAASLVHTGPASASDPAPPALGGYSGTAGASGLHAFYNPEGVLPLPPPVDIGSPDAYATIASGPATFARASVLDPGDLLANPDALLALGSSQYKPGTIPPYPYRVTASSGTGAPIAESSPAPGLNARVAADQSSSTAQATMPGGSTPALASVGSMASTATTLIDGATVTVHSISVVSNFNFLGILKIDSIVTDLQATSQGGPTALTGGTDISGATAMGRPITIDADGIHEAPGASPTTSPLNNLVGGVTNGITGNLNGMLAAAGIHVTFAGPIKQSGTTGGQLGSDGLRIDFELSQKTMPALKTLIDALPPLPNPIPGAPTTDDFFQLVTARHLVALELGRGVVLLTARPARGTTASTPSITPSSPGGSTPARSSAQPSAVRTGTDVVGVQVPNNVTSTSSEAPNVTFGTGVGILALLVLLLQPFIGERIAALSQGILAPGAAASCTWEER